MTDTRIKRSFFLGHDYGSYVPNEVWATIISHLHPDEITTIRAVSKLIYNIIIQGGLTNTARGQSLWQPTLNHLNAIDNRIPRNATSNVLQVVKTAFAKINLQQKIELNYLKEHHKNNILLLCFQSDVTTFSALQARNELLDQINSDIIEKYINASENELTLSLMSAHITRLPAELLEKPILYSYWTQLKTLDLTNNQLQTLPHSICNLQKLEYLQLFDNQLHSLPNTIGTLQQLTYLNLFKNRLCTLPETFFNLINLQQLSLSNNRLNFLSDSIQKLNHLKILRINNNQLQRIPDSICHLQNLEALSLNNNQCQHLPEAIGDLQILHTLRLENNQLQSLPASMNNLKKLRWLLLQNNLLQGYTLPDNLKNIDLGIQRPPPKPITLLREFRNLKLHSEDNETQTNENKEKNKNVKIPQ